MRRRILIVIAVLGLVLSGCGSGYDRSETTTTWAARPPVPLAPPNEEPYPDVFFENPGVNPFVDSEDDELSTFALDVDTGSYTVARRFVTDGNLPDKDSVRVEEFVNYFQQDYSQPEEGTFTISVDGAPTPYVQNERNRVVRVGIQAMDVADWDRKDAALTFVIDTSGSMEREDRLGAVKASLSMLVEELRPTDTVAIVEYGSRARVILEPTPIWEGDRILRAINKLAPNGSTNAVEGMQLGYRLAREAFIEDGINRVILASDGVANVGVTDAEGILDSIRRDAGRGIQLVTVGFGMGNYNDVLMEQLADNGNGFYAYVDTLEEAERLFVQDLTGTLQTVALDARVQVEFDAETVSSWRLIGFENRAIADEDFRDDTVDAGEVGAGHTVTALYEVKLTPAAASADFEALIGLVHLRWIDPDTRVPAESLEPITTDDLAESFRDASPRFQLDVLVAQYAEVLRDSYWAEQVGTSLEDLAEDVRPLRRLLPEDEDVEEFINLVNRAARTRR